MSWHSLLIGLTLLFGFTSFADGAYLSMGFKVGEVSSDSAIVWTRISKDKERNNTGLRPVGKVDKATKLEETPVEKLVGEVVGAPGEVRFTWSTAADFKDAKDSGWLAVEEKADFTKQWPIRGLKPATKYFLKIQARPAANAEPTAEATGSFTTCPPAEAWQDVRFAVITCQMYRDLDDPKGFHIYESMKELKPNFYVSTGDNVYYDSELPRAQTTALARYHWHRMFSLPRFVEFQRTTPCYFEKDDHDVLSDDCWPGMRPMFMLPMTFEEGQRLFLEQVPMGAKTYRTARWGQGLQVWFTEGRDFRSRNTIPDGPDKTIWGKEQHNWLMKSIEQSDAAFKVLVSPTPIVGPDRSNKGDNHANAAFAFEGNLFRDWTTKVKNFYVCNGDRHWQYMSIDPKTKLHEFSCGPASDEHAAGSPGQNKDVQPFHRVKGGFLSVNVAKEKEVPTIVFRFHDVKGTVVYEFRDVKR